jgi:hypothetical protein
LAVNDVLNDTLVWNGKSTTYSRREKIKNTLIQHYLGVNGTTKHIKCMLLDVELSRKVVIGAHIFKHEWNILSRFVGLDDIDDKGNCILLFAPIEKAFDRSEICFLVDAHGKFVLKLLNKNLQGVKLYNVAKSLGIQDIEMHNLDRNLTFRGRFK